ncbi:restriction endonuclease subunit S [Salinisphaera orenii]|uniref:restriction endonuclease subunit S n=1 Tax=Salinisphaera orenii TaxID=856731 RepID=UPI000F4C5BB4|nr:restriction endonuclease subunit S [Salinisphaera orenii]
MSERNAALEQHAVRDVASAYRVAPLELTLDGVPPGYKRTEVGLIPEDWGIGHLGEFYEIGSSKRVFRSDWRRYGVPFYRTREVAVLAGKGSVDNELYISEELYYTYAKKYGVPKPGDALITGIGTIGKIYVVPDDRKFYFKDASIIWLKSRQSFDSDYLKQLFETQFIRNQVADSSTGTTVDTYTISGANRTLVPVPRIAEQRAIATALSDADALIESLDRLIAKKRAIKQAAMQQLLTGQTRLPGFSGNWETKRLGEISTIAMGRTPRRNNRAFWGRGHVWLSIADLQGKVVSDSKEKITDLAAVGMTPIPKGTLLMSFKLSIGRLCFSGCNLFTNEAICSFTNLRVDAQFLYYALNRTDFSLYGKQAVKGYTLNSESLKLVEVSLPSGEEQAAIANVLSNMDDNIEALKNRRDKAHRVKQGMMQQLLTGRVRLVAPETA